MIEIKILVDDVDYDAAFEAFFPVVMDQMSQSSGNGLFSSLLSKSKGITAATAKMAFKALPEEKKEEMAVACLRRYQEDIANVMTQASRQKNISLHVKDVEITRS